MSKTKQWLDELREKEFQNMEFPEFISRKELYNRLDREYEEYMAKQKLLEEENEQLNLLDSSCDVRQTGMPCSNPNCKDCQNYFKIEFTTIKTENQ